VFTILGRKQETQLTSLLTVLSTRLLTFFGPNTAADFVDAMDENNYVSVELPKPMGIVFEENDSDFGGVFVQSLKEDGVAQKNGVLQEGDQLVAVNTEKVFGLSFDDALGKIVDAEGQTTKLLMFRGKAKQLYGPTGASQAWLDSFIAKGGVPASACTALETEAA
jgi:C-terminal processing protease CtpA/Prc